MRVLPSFGLLALSFLIPPPAVSAATVTFTGNVVNLCVLTLSTPGALGVGNDGTTLSSQATGGLSATLLVSATGSNPSLSFAAPTLTGPSASIAGATKEIAYTSGGGASQAFTSSASTYSMNRLLDTLTVQGRVTNAAGFAAGSYAMATVVTCQQ